MTKTIQEKEQFIQLRAQGLSFDRIAEELEVSKPTLLKWNGEFYSEVEEAQFHELDNLLNQFKVSRRNRFEAHSKLLNAVYEELNKRMENNKLEKLTVSELVKLADNLETKLEQETERTRIFIQVPDSWSFKKTEPLEL